MYVPMLARISPLSSAEIIWCREIENNCSDKHASDGKRGRLATQKKSMYRCMLVCL